MGDSWIVAAAVIGYVLYQVASFLSKNSQKAQFPLPPPEPQFDVPDFRPKPASPQPEPKQEEKQPSRKRKAKPEPPAKPTTVTMGELLEEYTRFQPKKTLESQDDESVIKYQSRHSILTEKDYSKLQRDKKYELKADQSSLYAAMLGDLDSVRDAFILNELLNRKNWDEEI